MSKPCSAPNYDDPIEYLSPPTYLYAPVRNVPAATVTIEVAQNGLIAVTLRWAFPDRFNYGGGTDV